ncbi:hypothetical protein EN850_20825 [Mesorhizobium sp. M8A.F.Ca.ET.207.01.1.1]|uniref:hypothetical protein n=1 Tax=Mesorhizobium sp. M8A.F.Ca.ET.207.01.1.1 TaxID=2563968 RepID=UPI00109D413D|nr:hypothetical protein [Mesorhizobium sp. M8A.F.Ca.ET.207.01.1.1]TGQ79335.1 hypothetical protein EN850_20825 [Mesorhizobium sp. M8A.F.Ca.ET.207.01.1.1]
MADLQAPASGSSGAASHHQELEPDPREFTGNEGFGMPRAHQDRNRWARGSRVVRRVIKFCRLALRALTILAGSTHTRRAPEIVDLFLDAPTGRPQ